jgi:hypothetical protein
MSQIIRIIPDKHQPYRRPGQIGVHRCPPRSDHRFRRKSRSLGCAPSKFILGDLFIGDDWKDFSRPLAGLVSLPRVRPHTDWWATFIRPPEADSLAEM